MPFSRDGVGEFCFVASGELNYINSWNMDLLEVNGQDFTNVWTNNPPASDDGKIHIHYVASVSYAHFEIDGTDGNNEPEYYELTTSVVGQGSVSPASGTYEEGTQVTLTAEAADGYVFDGWSGDASGTSATVTLTMDSDKSVTANFILDEEPELCENPEPISSPYTQDGSGEYCWVITQEPAFINSWNLDELTINGEDYTNTWSNSLPAAINGEWIIHYVASLDWAHFEMVGTKGADEQMLTSVERSVTISPNPLSDGIITVMLEGTEGESIIRLFSLNGNLVEELQLVDQNAVEMHLDAQPGMYILEVTNQLITTRKKLIIN
jgi:uncharacterized repeat protein (TIGR02543 family)